MKFIDIDLSGTRRKYSENDSKKITLDDELNEKIILLLKSKNIEDVEMALGIIKNANDDIKFLQLMEKIERNFKFRRDNKDKGGSIRGIISY